MQHRVNGAISCLIYTAMLVLLLITIGYLFSVMTEGPTLWGLDATIQDPSIPGFSSEIIDRSGQRGACSGKLGRAHLAHAQSPRPGKTHTDKRT